MITDKRPRKADNRVFKRGHPLLKQALLWSITVVVEKILEIPIWIWILVILTSAYLLYVDYIKARFVHWLLVLRNPGNHAAVIQITVKGKSVERIDRLFNSYINSPGYHKAYELDVVIIHYLKKYQLLEGDERNEWYMGRRREIRDQFGYTEDQIKKAMSGALKKYPELYDWRNENNN